MTMPEIGGVEGSTGVPHYGSVANARSPLKTEAEGPLNTHNETASRIETIAAQAKIEGGNIVEGELNLEQKYSQKEGLGSNLDILV